MTNRRFEVLENWTPRALPGGIYCSPACGGAKGFCKRADFDRATMDAGALAAQLGDGWEPRVWENLGWHWEVAKGTVSKDRFDGSGIIVRRCDHIGKYSAEFKCQALMCNHVTQFFAYGDAPEDAIGCVRQDVRTFISRIEADLADSI